MHSIPFAVFVERPAPLRPGILGGRFALLPGGMVGAAGSGRAVEGQGRMELVVVFVEVLGLVGIGSEDIVGTAVEDIAETVEDIAETEEGIVEEDVVEQLVRVVGRR